MKRLQFNKIKKNVFMLCALFISALSLTACSNLTYVGEDYDPKNSANILTNESFYFSTYLKRLEEENVSFRIGMSKTPVPEALAIYVQVNNNSPSEYVFSVKDLEISSANGIRAEIISPSNYLGAYQSSQAGAIASMSQMSGSFNNFATIANNYQHINQATPTMQTGANTDAQNSYKQISTVVEGVTKHMINNSAVIEPNQSKFFYIFISDPDNYPINIKYKGLSYEFMLKKIQPPEKD